MSPSIWTFAAFMSCACVFFESGNGAAGSKMNDSCVNSLMEKVGSCSGAVESFRRNSASSGSNTLSPSTLVMLTHWHRMK